MAWDLTSEEDNTKARHPVPSLWSPRNTVPSSQYFNVLCHHHSPSHMTCTTHSLPQSCTILQPHKHPIPSHSRSPYCTIFQPYKHPVPPHGSPNILHHSHGLSNIHRHPHRPRTCSTIPTLPTHLLLFHRAPHVALSARPQIPDARATKRVASGLKYLRNNCAS